MSIANASASANAPRTPASPVKTRASTTPSFPTATAIQPALHPSIPTAITVLEPMPQQVGVRQQEAERDARQRGQPGDVAPDREDEREPAGVAPRQQQPHDREDAGDDDDREEGDVPPGRGVPEVPAERGVGGNRGGETPERDEAAPAGQ